MVDMGNKKPRWSARDKKAAAILRKREESARVERRKLARSGILPEHLQEIVNRSPKKYIKGDNAPRPRRNMTPKERRLNTTARRKRRDSAIPFNSDYFSNRDTVPETPDILAGVVKSDV